MDKNLKAGIIILSIITSLFIGALWEHTAFRNAYNETLSTCNRSTKVNNHALEQRCGELQDAYNTEFLCDDYGCWLEVK